MPRTRSAWGLVLLALTAGCATAPPVMPAFDTADSVAIPSFPVARARMPEGPIPAQLKLPSGRGPFPAVIVLHGCGGRNITQDDWARRLNGWGYAALLPDSLTPRGLTTVCAPSDQPSATFRDRAGDAVASAAYLRTRPEIDPGRIAVLGQSHGGATAAWLAQAQFEAVGLRAAIDYYGPCREPTGHGTTPLLVLAGDGDNWGNPAASCATYGLALRPDRTFEIHTYPGVLHGFENSRLRYTVKLGHPMGYDAAAAEDSFIHVRAFLDRLVRH